MERKHFYIILGVAFLGLLISYTIANIQFLSPKSAEHPMKLESNLEQLIQVYNTGGDVLDEAEKNGIRYQDGMVRVIIELEDDKTSIPRGFNIKAEYRSGSFVQAWVPIELLHEIGQAPGVKYIKAPMEPLID